MTKNVDEQPILGRALGLRPRDFPDHARDATAGAWNTSPGGDWA
ncbi:hypothetical protein ACLQ28_14695 [Micromonospora sp. DT201]